MIKTEFHEQWVRTAYVNSPLINNISAFINVYLKIKFWANPTNPSQMLLPKIFLEVTNSLFAWVGSVVHKVMMLGCPGCEKFGCTRKCGHFDITGSEADWLAWWERHGLFRQYNDIHPEILCAVADDGNYQCPDRLCRRRYSREVMRSLKCNLSLLQLTRILFGYSVADQHYVIERDAGVTKNTITKVLQRVERVASWKMDFDVENAEKSKSSDETCFGKRKYGRGRKVCSNGQQWAQVITTTDRDGGKTRRVYVRCVPDRSARTLSAGIMCIAHRSALLRTDEWRGSRWAARVLGHLTVNHSASFSQYNDDVCCRIHTNNVEGANSMLKAESRRRFRMGKKVEARKRRIQAYGLLINGKLKSSESSPLAELFLAIKCAAEEDPRALDE